MGHRNFNATVFIGGRIMINAINYENLEYCFNRTTEDVCLFSPIFNRRSGKTTSLIKLAKKHNAIYIGSNVEICKLAQKTDPSIRTLSPRQVLNHDGLYEDGTVFVIDEVDEREINSIKKRFPHIRMFGLVKWEKTPNWMTLSFTESFLDDKDSDLQNINKGFFKEYFERSMEAGRGLEIICGR